MINELTRKNAHTELDHIFKTILPAHGMTERPEQIRLSHTMLDAMFENRIALSDAGTGIGKTYAYLTAAIVYSHSRLVDGLPFQPVIIATSSIALQNAIVREYLPFLSDALSDDPHITTPILAALRKGKSHYVCDERLRQHLQQRPNGKNVMQKNELYSLRDVLDLDETQKLSSFDRERVCVPQFCDCKHPDCRYRRHLTECGQKRYLFQICNQNLWLADCMHRENGLKPILPDACTVIVDEAHKLPETAREMFGTTLVAREIRSAVVRLKQDGYALAADRLFSASSMLLQKMAELSPEYPFELLHDDLSRVLSTLFLIGRKLSTFLEPATKRALEQLTDKVVLFLRPKTDAIRYTAEDDDGKLMLCSVPADITSRMQHTVWSKQIPLLLTSGTLAIGSSFRRFQDECGLADNPRVMESIAVSPFDYASNCRLFFPRYSVHLSSERYYDEIAAEILRLLYTANGHALVLFTSYPDIYPLCVTPGQFDELTLAQSYEAIINTKVPGAIQLGDESLTVVNQWELPSVQEDIELMYRWCQDGIIRMDAATVQESGVPDLKAGMHAAVIDATYTIDSETAVYPDQFGGQAVSCIMLSDAWTFTQAPIATVNAISTTSKNPTAAMQLLKIVNTDAKLFNLLCFGIEGTHYTVNEDGTASSIASAGYDPNTDWVFGDQFNALPRAGQSADIWEKTKAKNDSAKISTAMGFTFDASTVSNEIAACTAVYDQYIEPLTMGSIDPATGIPEMLSKLEAAGYKTILDEIQRQVNEWAGK